MNSAIGKGGEARWLGARLIIAVRGVFQRETVLPEISHCDAPVLLIASTYLGWIRGGGAPEVVLTGSSNFSSSTTPAKTTLPAQVIGSCRFQRPGRRLAAHAVD